MLHILKNIRVIEFKQGSVIYEEGDPADGSLYFILAGRVNVFKTVEGKSRQIDSLGEGQFFGEVGILIDYPRTATVLTASSTVRMARITVESFLQEAGQNMKFALKMIGITIQRLARIELKLQLIREPFTADLESHPLKRVLIENRQKNMQIAEMLHSLRSMVHYRGKKVYSEGDRDTGEMFMVLKGEVQLAHAFQGQEVSFYPLYAGDFFGMSTLTGMQRRPYSALVLAEHTATCTFDKSLFTRVLNSDVDLIFSIFRTFVAYSTILDECIRKKCIDSVEDGRVHKMEANLQDPDLDT